MAEKFVVNDYLEAAGSFDRLVELPDGRVVMADIKTGKDAARYAVATAAQVAIYANSMLYAVATDTRTAFPDAPTPRWVCSFTCPQARANATSTNWI